MRNLTDSPHFTSLCEAYPVAAITLLREQVNAAVERLEVAFALETIAPQLQFAREIAHRCYALLDRYEQEHEAHQRLIIGATRHFLEHLDSLSDPAPLDELNHDAAVINFVLHEVGIPERRLAIW